jgi:UDP-N-acetyl-2-amino-2-deoxyglucuronate dehydrogenase
MTSDLPLGFGLLGAGLVAPFHARAIQASRQAPLVGVTDLDAERLAKLAGDFNCRAYTSLDEMLADPAIQVVNVLTPNHLHTEAVVKAAHAGKHVLVEKPPATSLRDMDIMQTACATAGVKAGVVFQLRTLPAVQAIGEAIREGRFGNVYHADAFVKWYRPAGFYRMDPWRSKRQSGAGVTLQQGIHYIDLLQYLVGPAKRVQAQMSNITHPEISLEDTVLALVAYERGARGVVEASTAFWPGTDARIEINGENGMAVMVGEHIDIWKFRDDRPKDQEIRSYGNAAVPTGATGLSGMSFREHQSVIEDLVEAIESDREPMITLASARPSLECALAMHLSARRNIPVDLPLAEEEALW